MLPAKWRSYAKRCLSSEGERGRRARPTSQTPADARRSPLLLLPLRCRNDRFSLFFPPFRSFFFPAASSPRRPVAMDLFHFPPRLRRFLRTLRNVCFANLLSTCRPTFRTRIVLLSLFVFLSLSLLPSLFLFPSSSRFILPRIVLSHVSYIRSPYNSK